MDEIKTRSIKWHPKTNKIAQVPKEGLEYALVSDKFEQVHQLVWCKDFMQDAIYGFLNDQVASLYGFTYDPKTSPELSTKKTRLMITNWKDEDFGKRLQERALPLIHEVEDRLKMPHTVLERCIKVPPRYCRSGVWLLNGSKRWSKAPPMISMLTLLLRIGLVREPGDSLETTLAKMKNGEIKSYYSEDEQQDYYQAKRAEKGILHILKWGDKKIFYDIIKKNYSPSSDKYVSIYTIHDGCGIVAYSEGTTKYHFPHWHRLEGTK